MTKKKMKTMHAQIKFKNKMMRSNKREEKNMKKIKTIDVEKNEKKIIYVQN